jgi:hypothetical protein
LAKLASRGWKARYQQRYVQTEDLLFDIEIDLPEEQILTLLVQCMESDTPDRFSFPISFSFDLNRLVILRSLITIQKGPATASGQLAPSLHIQRLEAPTQPDHETENFMTYYSLFSPDAKAVAFVTGRPKNTILDSGNIEIWSEERAQDGVSKFRRKGAVKASRVSRHSDHSESFAFHPLLPLIAFTEWDRTSLWFFNTDSKNLDYPWVLFLR